MIRVRLVVTQDSSLLTLSIACDALVGAVVLKDSGSCAKEARFRTALDKSPAQIAKAELTAKQMQRNA